MEKCGRTVRSGQLLSSGDVHRERERQREGEREEEEEVTKVMLRPQSSGRSV